QPPFAQNGTVVNLRMSTRFCTKGDGFQFLAKFAILPQNANSPIFLSAVVTAKQKANGNGVLRAENETRGRLMALDFIVK
ncbi:hypothetical protein, partial [Klebsiella pneumoniae]